jgi:hypothetical protein
VRLRNRFRVHAIRVKCLWDIFFIGEGRGFLVKTKGWEIDKRFPVRIHKDRLLKKL